MLPALADIRSSNSPTQPDGAGQRVGLFGPPGALQGRRARRIVLWSSRSRWHWPRPSRSCPRGRAGGTSPSYGQVSLLSVVHAPAAPGLLLREGALALCVWLLDEQVQPGVAHVRRAPGIRSRRVWLCCVSLHVMMEELLLRASPVVMLSGPAEWGCCPVCLPHELVVTEVRPCQPVVSSALSGSCESGGVYRAVSRTVPPSESHVHGYGSSRHS